MHDLSRMYAKLNPKLQIINLANFFRWNLGITLQEQKSKQKQEFEYKMKKNKKICSENQS